MTAEALAAVEAGVVECRRCPRLVAWRERVGREKRTAYRDETYWARPVPGFGDPAAGLLIVGLAPAAHGANRTGRMFTGDRSGDFLYAGLHRAGFANRPESTHRGDGLELRGCFITAPVRCAPPANKPTPAERAACRPWLEAEVAALSEVRVVLALGAIGWDAALGVRALLGEPVPRPKPRFAHGAHVRGERVDLLGCFHVSQQNTFTGRLTPAMLDDVLRTALRQLS